MSKNDSKNNKNKKEINKKYIEYFNEDMTTLQRSGLNCPKELNKNPSKKELFIYTQCRKMKRLCFNEFVFGFFVAVTSILLLILAYTYFYNTATGSILGILGGSFVVVGIISVLSAFRKKEDEIINLELKDIPKS